MLPAPRVAALRLGNCGSDGAISASQAFEGIVITSMLRRQQRFSATERRERGAAHPVLIDPSLDDPCTALCVIDHAPESRAPDGKLSEVS
jgi:hypothetical protein